MRPNRFSTSRAGRRALSTVVGFFVALGLGGFLLFWTDPARSMPAAAEPRVIPEPEATGTVHAVEVPFDDPPHVPAGPNRHEFTAVCRLCHSPRLPLTQPRFPEKKWAAIVHKMVEVYGAPITPDQERSVVAYLTAVRGPGK